jgi:hypothetical protein
MLRKRGPSRSLPNVLVLTLFLTCTAGVSVHATAQETPPEAEAAEKQLPPAEEVLAAGLAEAERDGRLVFLHTGADW